MGLKTNTLTIVQISAPADLHPPLSRNKRSPTALAGSLSVLALAVFQRVKQQAA